VRQSVAAWLFDANDYRSAMRQVGIAAIIVGIVDTIYFIAAIARKQSFSSSLSIFAIVAGILLIRGNLKTCLAVAHWVGLTGGGAIGLIVGFAIITVWETLRNQHNFLNVLFRAGHVDLTSLVQSLLFTALLVWAYRTLTSPAVLGAMRSAGVDCDTFWKRPSTSLRAGIVIAAVALGFMIYFVGTSVQH
jgi:hypothetical protein